MLLLLKTLLFIIFHLGQRSYKNLGYLKLLYYHDLLRGEGDDVDVFCWGMRYFITASDGLRVPVVIPTRDNCPNDAA